jgi:hypothetical protein
MQSSAICLLISQIAKGQTGMIAIAGQCLTLVLEDLKRVRDLEMNRVTIFPFVIPAGTNGPILLPADYLRPYDLSYPLQTPMGMTQFLAKITMEQWDAEFKAIQTANYPYEFATDVSTAAQTWVPGPAGTGTMTSAGQMFIYPQSNAQINATFRYFMDQPDIAAPETSTVIPWFPHTKYLVTAGAATMMGITGDSRKAEFEAEAEKMLAPYLIQQGDEQRAVQEVKLDPRRFRSGKYAKPIKTMPY